MLGAAAYQARVAHLTALERQRTQIAMDLHDQMGSQLGSIGLPAVGISLGTVRSHITAIYRKLQVHNVAEAVSRALRQRLV